MIPIRSHSPWISTHCDLTGRPCQPSIDWWTKSNSACSFWKDFLSSQHYACYMPPWRPQHAFILYRDSLHTKFTNHSHPFRSCLMKKSWQIFFKDLGWVISSVKIILSTFTFFFGVEQRLLCWLCSCEKFSAPRDSQNSKSRFRFVS